MMPTGSLITCVYMLISVCPSIHILKEKQLELSTPKLVDTVDSPWQAVGIQWHWVQKVKGHGHRIIKCKLCVIADNHLCLQWHALDCC